MGLEGMIEDVIKRSSTAAVVKSPTKNEQHVLHEEKDIQTIAKAITLAEAGEDYSALVKKLQENNPEQPASLAAVLGITGTGGAGKSSVTDEIVRRFLHTYTSRTVAVISVDPSKKKTGGALLGDRIRMNSISHPRAYMRSLATRDSEVTLSAYVKDAINICKAANFDLIILESAGAGQSDASILDFVDVSLYVMTPEYGAASQLEKINMLDYANAIAINKFDKAGALDALMEVRKQYKRNHNLFTAADETLPIYCTMASKFGDDGVNKLFVQLIEQLEEKCQIDFGDNSIKNDPVGTTSGIIPANRTRYLAEISDTIRHYNNFVNEQASIATQMYQVDGVLKLADITKESNSQ
jgi:methylmalonyl-CoA mutase